jgi:hypothetical protein
MLDSQTRQETITFYQTVPRPVGPLKSRTLEWSIRAERVTHTNAVDLLIRRLAPVISTPDSHLYHPGRINGGTISESPHEANPGRLWTIDYSERFLTAPRHRQWALSSCDQTVASDWGEINPKGDREGSFLDPAFDFDEEEEFAKFQEDMDKRLLLIASFSGHRIMIFSCSWIMDIFLSRAARPF